MRPERRSACSARASPGHCCATWHLEQPSLGTITGQERSLTVALLGRFVAAFLPYHFDFVRNGTTAFGVAKKFGIPDTYS